MRLVIDEALAACDGKLTDVAAVASIDIKADKPALLQFAHEQGWSIRFYSATEIATVEVPNPSETVRKHTGRPSVSEGAALLAAQPVRPDKSQLLIEKHRLRGPDGHNATVSIARITE